VLGELANIVTPETLLTWHRKLVANKYDGSAFREPGRPSAAAEIEAEAGVFIRTLIRPSILSVRFLNNFLLGFSSPLARNKI